MILPMRPRGEEKFVAVQREKAFSRGAESLSVIRDDWIRTSDLTHPKRARYQAAPHPAKALLVCLEKY